MKPSYTIEEAALYCQTSIWTVHRRIREGTLKSFRAGGGRTVRIPREELIRFLQENKIPLPAELAETSSKRILIVDDDEKIVRSLVRYVRARGGMEVESASSGFRAGVLIKSFKPQVVVLDIMLGDINGREVIRTIRSDEEHKGIKVIAISGFIKQEEVQSLLDSGFDDYLGKPFKLAELMQKIDRHLGQEASSGEASPG
jgi:excisionase family DNA binding protein